MIWTTRDGRKIPIKDMEDSHLNNTIKYMKRRIKAMDDEEAAGWRCYTSLQGDMATYYCEQDLSRIADNISTALAILYVLTLEQKRRTKK